MAVRRPMPRWWVVRVISRDKREGNASGAGTVIGRTRPLWIAALRQPWSVRTATWSAVTDAAWAVGSARA
ncbi:hypothetical protein ACWGCW_04330 [Streptomyces sp. NPDC054933]